MNVTVSVFGRFHAFDLALQLHRRGHLERIITTYPRFVARSFGLPPDRTISFPLIEGSFRLWNRLPSAVHHSFDARFVFQERFDWAAARRIPNATDVFVGWSGFSERGIRRARKRGAVCVLDRGAAHIETQRELLREEFERRGVWGELPGEQTISKEVREYDLADYISVPSSFVRRTFIERGIPPEKLVLLPLGVNLSQFPTAPQVRDDTFRVLYAGAMSLQKGVPYLLQAWSELRLPHAELWLVGPVLNELRPSFARYEGQFRHFAPVPQGELHRLYAQGSVFVLPSIQDGFGMVMTQAMATGLPVIATTHSGGPDVVTPGKDGFIVPPGDVGALKEALLYLYDHPDERRNMGRTAAEKTRTAYSWDDYGDRAVAAYASMLQHRNGRQR